MILLLCDNVHVYHDIFACDPSGHFYKVNVPVVVTQAPRSNRVFPQHAAQQAPPAPPQPQPAPNKTNPTVHQVPTQTSNLEPVLTDSSTAVTVAQAGQQMLEPPAPVDEGPQAPVPQPAKPPPLPPPVTPQTVPESPGEFTLEGIEFSPQPEPNLKQEQGQLLVSEVGEESSNGLDTPEKGVKEETPDGLPVSDSTAFASLGSQLDEAIKVSYM